MENLFVFLFCFLSFFLLVLLGKILSLLGHNEKSSNFCPFFKSVMKILFSSVFLSCSLLLCFLLIKRDEKKGEDGREKILFCSLTLHTKEKKEEKKFSLLRRKKRFLKRFIKSLLLLERTLCALE